MTMVLRKSDDRGHANHGWLDTRHTFSFADYHDPDHMGFGALRVINDDRIAPGGGFRMHPHRDMEIVTVVLEGALAHKDSLGNGSVIRPGDVQRMSAGTGIRHSEFNASESEPLHLLQIWIVPERTGLPPSYEQTSFGPEQRRGRLCLVGSREGRDGSVVIHRDVDLYVSTLSEGHSVQHVVRPGRGLWLQVARGAVRVNGALLEPGDAVSFVAAGPVVIEGVDEAEILLFDLAMDAGTVGRSV